MLKGNNTTRSSREVEGVTVFDYVSHLQTEQHFHRRLSLSRSESVDSLLMRLAREGTHDQRRERGAPGVQRFSAEPVGERLHIYLRCRCNPQGLHARQYAANGLSEPFVHGTVRASVHDTLGAANGRLKSGVVQELEQLRSNVWTGRGTG